MGWRRAASIGGAGLACIAGVLLYGAWSKASDLAGFRAALIGHQVVPLLWVAPLSIIVVSWEGLLGAVAAVCCFLPGRARVAVALAVTFTFVSLFAYTTIVMVRGLGAVPCGCGGGGASSVFDAAARSAVLIIASTVATALICRPSAAYSVAVPASVAGSGS